jgi:muramidase (phage lysozyme)
VTRDDLFAALTHDNTLAFLSLIREGESSQDNSAYSVMFGGKHFESFADHPRIKNTAGSLTSTAAGAYQFISRTWDEMAQRYGLEDFSPRNQDCAAVGLIARRGALDDVLAGRIETAIQKCRLEWASLPGSTYGQPTQKLEKALAVYKAHGGRIASESSSPDVPDATRREVKPMAPLIIPILSMLADAIPALGKMFGSGSEVAQRNVAAGTMIAEELVKVTNSVNLQEAAEKIQSDSTAAAAAQAAVAGVLEIIEAGGGGIDGAGKRAAAADGEWRKVVFSGPFILAVAVLPLVYAVVLSSLLKFPWLAEITSEVRTGVITSVTGLVLGSLMGYFYGTSASSQRKDSLLANNK